MKRYSIPEWGYLEIAEDDRSEAIPRRAANELLAAVREAGFGENGEQVLFDGHRRLRAQQVVGVIAAPHARLEILPKIDGLDEGATRRFLVHMLAKVFDLDVNAGRMAQLGWQRSDLLEIVIRGFCERLFEVVRRGLPRRYLELDDDLKALRGRLDIKRQFTALLTSPQLVACRYDELGPDIALNQIMKATVGTLLRVSRSEENQRLLRELSLAFVDVRAVPIAQLPWGQVILDRSNQAWSGLVAMAKFLLRRRYQTTSEGEQQGLSLLFPMNTLFEEYIGRGMRTALQGPGVGVKLQGPRDFVLRDESGAQRFATKPDITVFVSGKAALVIDTKWKRLSAQLDDAKQGVSQSDVYQMLAYARVYGVQRLLLLYPHHDGLNAPEGILSRFRFGGDDMAELCIGSVKLAAPQLEERLRVLATSTGVLD